MKYMLVQLTQCGSYMLLTPEQLPQGTRFTVIKSSCTMAEAFAILQEK